MDKQEAHGAGAEDGVGGVRGGTAGFEGQGERRLEGEEPGPRERRHRMRALQEGQALRLSKHQAALAAEEEEKHGPRHELRVELADRFPHRQGVGIAAVPEATCQPK